MYRMVIFPVLFRPPDFFKDFTKDFSGVDLVISPKSGAILNRWPGVIGLIFFIPIIPGD
jgi:hypothetical protein